jgi:hypothetical protein
VTLKGKATLNYKQHILKTFIEYLGAGDSKITNKIHALEYFRQDIHTLKTEGKKCCKTNIMLQSHTVLVHQRNKRKTPLLLPGKG